ncbi:MAG: hypothetical protein GX096_08885 [Clostridiales bacterium]|nr:hypothetical protein [Clostridiales bacterium]
MKKRTALVAICLVLCMHLPIGMAQEDTKNMEVFTQTQLSTSLYTQQMVMLGDTLYAYLDNETVWSWRPSDPAPNMYCQLPKLPEATGTVYHNLEDDEKARWDETVSFIATGDDTLWGINSYSGKIGKITEEGIAWDEVQLDMSPLMPQGNAWPLRVANAFVINNTLYAYIAMDNADYPKNNYEMLAFDLASGSYKYIDIQNAQGICSYHADSILMLQPTADNVWMIQTMDLSTETISDSPFQPFQSSSDQSIGGMAYDAASDRLFFTAESQVWGGAAGEAYASVAFLPVHELVGEAIAFALGDGRYALFSACLYVRDVQSAAETNPTLYAQGCTDQTIYESFTSENPNIPVEFLSGLLSPDEIVQLLVTGDQAADLYAVFADHTFSAIVQKGYAADLSSSAILTSDIGDMYPNIQHAITDEAGHPVAYPFQLLLGHWQVNEALWHYIYGDTPIPATYDQFLDAMLLWESSYADEYPEVDFSMNFDHAYWARTLVNAYAQQYGQPNVRLEINTDLLRGVLEKLQQVRDIRDTSGRSVHFADDYMPKADLFITAGYNNVLLEPVESQEQEDQSLDEIMLEGQYIDMPSLVFTEGEASCVLGKMLVWFVNPYSQNKEVAIRYLEHAARMNNNERTYYATHPNHNDPLAYKSYEQSAQELKTRQDELTESLKDATALQRSTLEETLIEVENSLANLEKRRWDISENAIAHYRSFAPSISFFEDNQYITPDGSLMLQQLEDLYERYAYGTINLDGFLRELDEKMYVLYLEGQ